MNLSGWKYNLSVTLGVLLSLAGGCVWHQAKTCCPIYPPRTYAGTSEAIRRPPCGPDAIFHGMKKTQWCEWPVGWEMFPAKCMPCENCDPPMLEPEGDESLRLPPPDAQQPSPEDKEPGPQEESTPDDAEESPDAEQPSPEETARFYTPDMPGR